MNKIFFIYFIVIQWYNLKPVASEDNDLNWFESYDIK